MMIDVGCHTFHQSKQIQVIPYPLIALKKRKKEKRSIQVNHAESLRVSDRRELTFVSTRNKDVQRRSQFFLRIHPSTVTS
jgi:hypothetical protein